MLFRSPAQRADQRQHQAAALLVFLGRDILAAQRQVLVGKHIQAVRVSAGLQVALQRLP